MRLALNDWNRTRNPHTADSVLREIHEKQVQILVPAVDHPVAKEIQAISDVLDAEPKAAALWSYKT